MARPHNILIYITLLIFLAVLFFGLNPQKYDFSNHVSWLGDDPGIHFNNYGIVYTELDRTLLKQFGGHKGFSILLVFQPDRVDKNGSGTILTIHPGEDKNQLTIWQWYSHIIAMNDNDYDNRRKIERVSAEIPASPAQQIFLSLTSGENGTHLYFNDKVVSSKQNLRLHIPAGEKAKLVLGNSVYGNGSWKGNISGLALFDRQLPPESIFPLYNAWKENRSFTGVEKEVPLLHYLFKEKNENRILDYAETSTHMRIPAQAAPLKKIFLDRTLIESRLTGGWIQDVIVNLLGFIPLGFCLAALMARFGAPPDKRTLLFAVIFCSAVSLSIELIQAWIPSRSSQLLDLLLNTAGAVIGAFLANKGIMKKYLYRSH